MQDNLLLVLVYANLLHEDSRLLATFNVVYNFEVPDFKEYNVVQLENGLFHVPVALDEMLRQVSISTTRGIIYSEIRGTYLHGAIMPIVFAKAELANGDVALKDLLTEKKDE